MIRNRKKSPYYGVEIVKSFDSFPKVNKDDYVQRSGIGGTASVIGYVIIVWIMIYEIKDYFGSNVNFKFCPDTQFDAKLKVNLDLTVAMPCHNVGADILDSTNQDMLMFGTLEEEDTWFEMSPEQRSQFEDIQYFNKYLQTEFHEVHELLWKSAHSFRPFYNPKTNNDYNRMPDACRVFGTLELNKVAGNLHLIAGKAFPVDFGHIHIPLFVAQNSYNFSHRIHHLSFGDSVTGIIHPLDGDEKITLDSMTMYQYFIEIVPTDVDLFLSKSNTYQYSVKDNQRVINHDKGSHGTPGIYINYDFSALKVVVTQSREPLIQFFVRLSSTIAGIFITAGLICNLLQKLVKAVSNQSNLKTTSDKLDLNKMVI